MSTLIIDELYDGVVIDQTIKINRDLSVSHIRPWIYKEGTIVDGELRLTILQASVELLTVEITTNELNKIPEPYSHGFVRFDFDNLVLHVEEGEIETEYTLRFQMVNHTTDRSNYIALVRRWEAKTYPTYGDGVIDNEAPNDYIEPFGLEIFEYKKRN